MLASCSQRINSGTFLFIVQLTSFKPHRDSFLPFLCELAKLKQFRLDISKHPLPQHCADRDNLDGEWIFYLAPYLKPWLKIMCNQLLRGVVSTLSCWLFALTDPRPMSSWFLCSKCCFRRSLDSFHHGCSWYSLLLYLSMAQRQYRQSKRPSSKLSQILLGAKFIYSRWWDQVINMSIESSHDGRKELSQLNFWAVCYHALLLLKELCAWGVWWGMRKSWGQRQDTKCGHRRLVWPINRFRCFTKLVHKKFLVLEKLS